MGRSLRCMISWLEHHSGWLLGVGLVAAIWVNARQWQKDRRAALRLYKQRNELPISLPSNIPLPRVSLLIPAWNEAAHLPSCLSSIIALRYPEKEVIICAGGKDGTLEIARRYAGRGVIAIEQAPGEGKQSALQRCFECSTGEIIFLTDADSLLDDECFELTVAPIITGSEIATTGSRQPLTDQRHLPLVTFQWADHLYQECTLPDYINAMFGVNAAIHRNALEKSGAFTGHASIGTDLYLAHRLMDAGFRIRYIRHSRVQTEYKADPFSYVRQQSRWFRNRFVYGMRDCALGDVFSQLRAGLAAFFMLTAPMFGFGFRILWVLWLAAFTHLSLSHARLTIYAYLVGEKTFIPYKHKLDFFRCMVIGWFALALGLGDSFIPNRRNNW